MEASVVQSDSQAKCKDDFCGEGSVPPPPLPLPHTHISPSAVTAGISQIGDPTQRGTQPSLNVNASGKA